MKKISDRLKELNSTYVGRVEDRADPNKQGRVRVRVFSLHSEDIISEKLPWFLPAYPINVASNAGIGDSGIPQVGSTVVVQFIEGNIMQGIYTHTIPGENDLPNPETYLEEPADYRQIKTPSGHIVEIKEKEIRIKQNDEETLIEINDGVITINGAKNVNVKSSEEVNIEGSKITLKDSTNKGNLIINSDKFLTAFLNHIHPTGVGPSGTVIPASAGLKLKQDWFTNSIEVD